VYFYTNMSPVFLVWIAFVLTRPFGATLGDFLTKANEKGGLDFGTIGSSLILASMLGLLIIFTTLNKVRMVAQTSGSNFDN
jgi:uncharacterized membrane-anchored protein